MSFADAADVRSSSAGKATATHGDGEAFGGYTLVNDVLIKLDDEQLGIYARKRQQTRSG